MGKMIKDMCQICAMTSKEEKALYLTLSFQIESWCLSAYHILLQVVLCLRISIVPQPPGHGGIPHESKRNVPAITSVLNGNEKVEKPV